MFYFSVCRPNFVWYYPIFGKNWHIFLKGMVNILDYCPYFALNISIFLLKLADFRCDNVLFFGCRPNFVRYYPIFGKNWHIFLKGMVNILD